MLRKKIAVLLALSTTCACSRTGAAADAFLDRNGRTFTVSVNGSPISPIEPLEIQDITGSAVATVTAAAVVEGRFCLAAEGSNPGLGGFKQLSLQVLEVHRERPRSRWREFNALPTPAVSWQPKTEYCPDEFILTERLRFKTLPKGRFVFIVRYNGTQNWDMREILVEVK